MNWEHVKLIFARELRDQLRDRRTMFTIAVLPLLLYPLMGMLMLQIAQFNREHPVRVGVVGTQAWPERLPLIQEDQVLPAFVEGNGSDLLRITHLELPSEELRQSNGNIPESVLTTARQSLAKGEQDLVLIVHPKMVQRLEGSQENVEFSNATSDGSLVTLVSNRASDRSLIAERRIRGILDRWQRSWVAMIMKEAQLNPELVRPFPIGSIDVAPPATRSALVWSKLLPFVMLVWALTGAFYPAVDLCAGEKERGTLETLLSSPARRKEIVWGKLLTVMCFSVCTALLNLFSMQMTATLVMRQFTRLGSENLLETLGPLPVSSIGWLVIMLLPMSALFSALAMAVASLARSSKEGQYYLMPLLLVGMPLVMLPMLPGVTLTVGTSIVPVTGAVLLARAFIEGQFHEALIHLPS